MSYRDQIVDRGKHSSPNVAVLSGHNESIALGAIPASSSNTSNAVGNSRTACIFNSVFTMISVDPDCLLMLHIAEIYQIVAEPGSIKAYRSHFEDLDTHGLGGHSSACSLAMEAWPNRLPQNPSTP